MQAPKTILSLASRTIPRRFCTRPGIPLEASACTSLHKSFSLRETHSSLDRSDAPIYPAAISRRSSDLSATAFSPYLKTRASSRAMVPSQPLEKSVNPTRFCSLDAPSAANTKNHFHPTPTFLFRGEQAHDQPSI